MKTFIKHISNLVFLCSALIILTPTVQAGGNPQELYIDYATTDYTDTFIGGTASFYDGNYPQLEFARNENFIEGYPVYWSDLDCDGSQCHAHWHVMLSSNLFEPVQIHVLFNDGYFASTEIDISAPKGEPDCDETSCG
jgi:hypothetical protein